MTNKLFSELQSLLATHGQEHLLAHWDSLSLTCQDQLAKQIRAIDFGLLATLRQTNDQPRKTSSSVTSAVAPPAVPVELCGTTRSQELRALGNQTLESGKLGMILVAGGQGTRLGFGHAKGLFPIGPISDRPLFQVLIDHLIAIRNRYQTAIPLFVMTSPATHEETAKFLAAHDRFGLPEDDLFLFCQGTMPVLDARTGQILLEQRGRLCLSPDGHGGILEAFARTGCLAEAEHRGIEHLFYAQIDNPLVQVCDPWLIGCHLQANSEMTTQVIRKEDALERVGNVVSIGGRLQIIEYSDLSADSAHQTVPDGTLKLWAGNIGVHIFQRQFLERMAASNNGLQFHQALKQTAYCDRQGRHVTPAQPNSIKFEKFIFDLLPAAQNAIVVEASRNTSFAPVKNADGERKDTPAAAKQRMLDLYANWVATAKIQMAENTQIEINPRFALDAQELASRIPTGHCFSGNVYLGPDRSFETSPAQEQAQPR